MRFIINFWNIAYSYSGNKLTGGTNPETGSYTVKYDQQNRINEYDYQSGSAIIFYYNSDNSIDHQITSLNGTALTITRYDYNSTGQIIAQHDSLLIDSTLTTYQYPNTSTFNRSTSTVIYFNLGGPIKAGTSQEIWSYEYDNKINPMLLLDSANTFRQPKNNVTKMTGLGQIIIYSYTYNSRGYPLTQTEDSQTGIPFTVRFTYSCQ